MGWEADFRLLYIIYDYKLINTSCQQPKGFSYYDLESLKFPGGMQIKVVGIRNGKQETEIENLTSNSPTEQTNMTKSTAVPIAVLSEAIVLGEIKQSGAYAPEALDADLISKFLDEITNRI